MNTLPLLFPLRPYGHNTMFALRGSEGYLCHSFWVDESIEAVILFADPKTAKAWMKKVEKEGHKLQVQPQPITQYPEGMKVTIHPAEDASSIGIIVKKSFWRNW